MRLKASANVPVQTVSDLPDFPALPVNADAATMTQIIRQWWDVVRQDLQQRSDEVVSPLNDTINAASLFSSDTSATIKTIQSKLTDLQNQLSADIVPLQQFTALGRMLATAADVPTARTALGFTPGDNVAVGDPTSQALTGAVGSPDEILTDVGAAFSQSILNHNFSDLANQVNALVTDMLAVMNAVNVILNALRDQNLVATQLPS